MAAARRSAPRRSSSSASWGPARPPRPNAARAAGLEAVDADDMLEEELGMPIITFFGKRGEEEFRGLEAAEVGRLLAGRRRRRGRAGRRRRLLGAGAEGARPPHRRLASGLRRGGVAAGRGERPAAGEGPRALRGAPPRARADLRAAGGRHPAVRRRGAGRPGAAVAPRPPRASARNADGVGDQRLGRVPGLRGAGDPRRGLVAAREPALLRRRHDGRRPLRRRRRAASTGRSRWSPGSGPRRWPRPSASCASWRSWG